MRKIGAIKQKRINALIIWISIIISLSIVMSIPDKELPTKPKVLEKETHLEPVPDTDYLLYIPSKMENRIKKFKLLDNIKEQE